MRIEQVDIYPVAPRWQFVRIITDSGLEGWGETTLEGNTEAVGGAIDGFRRLLIGEDPTRITHLWQTLYRGGFYRGGPVLLSAIGGIDQALWDIRARTLDVPVYALLGGAVRNRIRMYAHVHGDTPDSLAAAGRTRVAAGYTALKTSIPGPLRAVGDAPYVSRLRDLIGALRETVGPEVDIAIDLHGRSAPAQSVVIIGALQDLRPMFYEEPTLPESLDALSRVRRAVPDTLATGERLYGKSQFFDLVARGLVDIDQPDLTHAGGIGECRAIAAMAESRQIGVAPHCPLGPVALSASLQLDAAIPNFVIQEHVTVGDGYLKAPFELEDGFLQVPDAAGLGIEVDVDAVRAGAPEEPWQAPRWTHEDGSVADW